MRWASGYRSERHTTMNLRDRIRFGATARGFQRVAAETLGYPKVFAHANGQEIHIGERGTVKVIDSDGKLRRATGWEAYMLAQDGDLLHYNGLRPASRQGAITKYAITGQEER